MNRSIPLVAILFVSAPAFADDPAGPDDGAVQVLPCRPTIACTAEIVPAGTLEVETGYAQRRASGDAVHSVQALLKYSVTDRVQLQVGTNNVVTGESSMPTQTFDGVYGGAKVVLVPQSARVPAIAISALFMAPTRSGDAAVQRTADGYFWAYASKDLPVIGVHADLNVGVNVLSLGSAPKAQIVTALSLSRDLGRGVGLMLEGYAYEGGAPYATHDAGVLSGFTYSVMPQVMLDAGLDIALYRDARDVTFFGGVTFAPYAR